MDQVVVHTNLVFANTGTALSADLYLPPTSVAAPPHPVVFFVHGGLPPGMPGKDMEIFLSWGRLIAACGIAGITFNHRMRWNPGYDALSVFNSAQDVHRVVEFAHQNAARFGLDPKRICIFAFSAGGPLLTEPIGGAMSPRCLVGFYPFLGDPLLGLPEAGRHSPLLALQEARAGVAPIFLAKAGQDNAFINGSIDAFVEEAKRLGANVSLVEHPTGLHGFDALNDDDRSRAIIREAIDFVRRHLA